MAVFNERRYIREDVDSILRQTWSDLELLVVDDGSTDGGLDELATIDDPRLVVHRQENRGKAEALNWILDAAKGDYIALQDGDDTSYPQRLEAQVAALERNPALGAVFCRHDLIIDGRRCFPCYRGVDTDECAERIERGRLPALDPTIMFRREMTADIRFDPQLLIGHGEDHLIAIGERFPLEVVDGCWYSYRVHDGNMSRRSGSENHRYAVMVADRAAARRGRPAWSVEAPLLATTASVDSYAIDSTVEMVALGRRRTALVGALRHLRTGFTRRSPWLCLAYALSPGAVLQRVRPDFRSMIDAGTRFQAYRQP